MTQTRTALRVVLGTLAAALLVAGSSQAASKSTGVTGDPAPRDSLAPSATATAGEAEATQSSEQEAEEQEVEPAPILREAPSEAPPVHAKPLPEQPPVSLAPDEAAAWGQNGNWELGAGYKNNYTDTPVAVMGLGNVKAVASGYHFSLALLNDGTVRTWGGNTFGQLGDGSRENSAQPVSVKELGGVTAIVAGAAHALALLSNGTVVTWGGNTYGELGNGTSGHGVENGTASTVPVPVPGLTHVVAIAAGGADDVALLSNGTLEAWGENKAGQLGDGTTVEKDVPTPVRGVSAVKAIAVGGDPSEGGHMLALLNNNTVMAWGGNASGQLGNGSITSSDIPSAVKNLTDVVGVSASISHSMALLGNGAVMVWGSDTHGELGSAPEVCKGAGPCSRSPIMVSGLGNVSAISAGMRFSLALREGKVFGWGVNELGQLGDGTTTATTTPVQVSELTDVSAIAAGEQHSVALLEGPGPTPAVEGTPGVASIVLRWHASGQTSDWKIAWRPVQRPSADWSKYVTVSPAARGYMVSGLGAGLYEVAVQNKSGRKVVRAAPLG